MVSQNIPSLEELWATLRKYPEAYLFVGWGSRAQYADVEEVLSDLRPFLRDIQQRCGGRRWLIVFGGDKAREEAPDIGWVVKRLQDEYGCDLLAVQAAGQPDEHTTYHFLCAKEFSPDGNRLYGGFVDGRPVSATQYYLADQVINPDPISGRRLLTGCFTLGGGNVAVQEVQYSDEKKLPWTYVPSRARFTEVYGEYGPVHDWVTRRLADGARPRVAAVSASTADCVVQAAAAKRPPNGRVLLESYLAPAAIGCLIGVVGVRLLAKRVR